PLHETGRQQPPHHGTYTAYLGRARSLPGRPADGGAGRLGAAYSGGATSGCQSLGAERRSRAGQPLAARVPGCFFDGPGHVGLRGCLRASPEPLKGTATMPDKGAVSADAAAAQRAGANLRELAALTSTPEGAQRVAWGPVWRKARAWFQHKVEE